MLKNLVPANLYQFSRLFTERVYRHSHYLAPYSQRESDRSSNVPCNWPLDYSAVSTYCLDDLQSISP